MTVCRRKRNRVAAAVAAVAVAALALMAPAARAQTPIEQDVLLRHVKTNATMVPWWGGTANDTVVRVWPYRYTGDVWNFRYAGTYTDPYGRMWPMYQIVNVKSDRCLQPKDRAVQADALLVLYDCSTSSQAQQWILPESSDFGSFQIAPVKRTSLGITLQNRSWNGSSLQLAYRNPDNPDFNWQTDVP
ncbi:RICIN domain-containing protein [Streptomyces sp. RB6PN25]|uniref:RICIN domain-containing protein n=1 Tax=Streptomyces humicola TaxID=2953240 RepID=A0ABT1PXH8_9ACTN|nr:RICIN domain-containing protein [Streptomyces humicola]MCQ4082367.1 RICIN domain-containing protein [Streptomyces humicola]